jgi:hypothetical protein
MEAHAAETVCILACEHLHYDSIRSLGFAPDPTNDRATVPENSNNLHCLQRICFPLLAAHNITDGPVSTAKSCECGETFVVSHGTEDWMMNQSLRPNTQLSRATNQARDHTSRPCKHRIPNRCYAPPSIERRSKGAVYWFQILANYVTVLPSIFSLLVVYQVLHDILVILIPLRI